MTRRASRMLMGVLSVTTLVGVTAYAVTHRNNPTSGDKSKGSGPTALNSAGPNAGQAALKVDGAADAHAPATTRPSGRTLLDIITSEAGTTGASGAATQPSVHFAVQPAAPAAVAQVRSGVAEGKAKIDSGDLPAGRKLLNEALMSGRLSDADAATAKQLISDANKLLVFAPRRYAEDTWAMGHTVARGEMLQKIASKYEVTPELLLRINGLSDPRKLRAATTIKVIQGPFHAVVTKHAFTLDVYLGSPGEKTAQYVTTYPVGLGKEDSTPSGTWIIDSRIPNPKWWGARGLPPIEAGDPKNPLGKFWIALVGIDGKAEGQQSYGIHGTIEPESIGKQASMGCIRMKNEDVAMVYELLVSGKSTVVVKE